MGYRTLGRTEDVLQGYTARAGLEGPFAFANGQVLYYDAREGAYYNPRSDFYLSQEEADLLHTSLVDRLKNQ